MSISSTKNTCESLRVMWTSMKIIGNHVEHMGTHVNIDENHIDIIDNHACCFASGSCSLPLLKNKGGRAHYSSCTIHAGMGVALLGRMLLYGFMYIILYECVFGVGFCICCCKSQQSCGGRARGAPYTPPFAGGESEGPGPCE